MRRTLGVDRDRAPFEPLRRIRGGRTVGGDDHHGRSTLSTSSRLMSPK